MAEKQMSSGKKAAIVGLVAGVLGGGIAAGGVSYLAAQRLPQTMGVVPAGNVKSGPVKVEKSEVKGESQATTAFNKVSGAVVSVINVQKQGSMLEDRDFFSDRDKKQKDEPEKASEGSGVIYQKQGEDAYVVTNNHVVADSKEIQVLLSDGNKVPAKVVGTDEVTDLAVLKMAADKVKKVADFTDSDAIQPGQTALAIGSPLGSNYATSVTEGIISAPKRSMDSRNSRGQSLGTSTVIQTDAAINPGNSGGPLVNLAGQVMGINSMKLAASSDGVNVEGMGFAIPSNTVVSVIKELEKNGKVSRPSLGVSLLDLQNVSDRDQSQVLKLPRDVRDGVVLMKVNNGSDADKAGLKKYDVLTKVDGKEIKGAGDLRDVLYEHKLGDTLKVTYYREGKTATTEVKLT